MSNDLNNSTDHDIRLEQSSNIVPLDQDAIPNLNTQIDEFIHSVITLDIQQKDFQDKVNSVHQLGQQTVVKTAGFSQRLLSRSIKKMDDDEEAKGIGQSLIDLKQTLEALNPANNTSFFSKRKLLGFIPFGSKIEDYFDKYKSAEAHLSTILIALDKGRDELLKDNIGIEHDKKQLWTLMQQLEQYIYIGRQLEQILTEKLYDIELQHPEKARVIKEEVVFYLHQKITDLLTQQAVGMQSYLSLDLIRKNNFELIKGVERATTTTVAALRTAIVVAQALANQKLVLKQVDAVNKTTEDLIVATSKMLKNQTKDIQIQASSSVINLDKLQTAFNNTFETINMVNDFKIQSIDKMHKNIEVLNQQLETARSYLDQNKEYEVKTHLASHQIKSDNGNI
ncbi:toxic anion resistance protein [Alkanindiges illinoisensis]|uniref:toxic anion resistance protein n=1 Tax=Alkanindiges illinoisensis TaxID=197183 RepID=UPI000686C9D9|nr:toxic anion resistance protein [Alkanindiges illinoisensis]